MKHSTSGVWPKASQSRLKKPRKNSGQAPGPKFAVDRVVTYPSDAKLPNRSQLASTKFRSRDASLMVIILLPHADPAMQIQVLKRLFILLEANPSNIRSLCQMHVVPILLRLCLRLPEEVQPYYLQLVATLGLYDIAGKEARLLFDLASLRPEDIAFEYALENGETRVDKTWLRRGSDLQMQLLWIIGRLAERTTPQYYFNFDGVASNLVLDPLTKFPAVKQGYAFCCWLRVQRFFGLESSLLTWQSQSGEKIFELLWVVNANKPSSRLLAVRSKQNLSIFSDFVFEENGEYVPALLFFFLGCFLTCAFFILYSGGTILSSITINLAVRSSLMPKQFSSFLTLIILPTSAKAILCLVAFVRA
jgi:hypothetical protein